MLQRLIISQTRRHGDEFQRSKKRFPTLCEEKAPAYLDNACVTLKPQPVIDAILAEQQPMFERAQKYLDDPSLLRSIIADGSDKARKVAQETMREVRESMGLA